MLAWLLAVALVMPAPVRAQAPAATPIPKVKIDILADHERVRPGDTVWIGLRQRIEPAWHTYWVNPGDSGEPTVVRWQLPEGFSAGPLQWPVPEAIPVGPLTNYGYSDEVVLLARLTVPKEAKPGSVTLAAEADWLVCKDICIPESGRAERRLTVVEAGGAIAPGGDVAAIEAARRALPQAMPWPVEARHSKVALEVVLKGFGPRPADLEKAHVFPLKWGIVRHAAAQRMEWRGSDLVLQLVRGEESKLPERLEAVLALEQRSGGGPVRQGFVIESALTPTLAHSDVARGAVAGTAAQTAAGAPPIGWAKALLLAFLGGLVLNLMPCVLPVLSLKAFSLAAAKENAAGGHAGQTSAASHGTAYLAGVMASFVVLWAALMLLRRMGEVLGWGMQFQSPVFVLLMAGVFLLLGLNMSGVFHAGGSLAGAGDRATRAGGALGSFATGALATLAATPCTAPFMGAAMGYAMIAAPLVALSVLLAMGLGFAAPMTALAGSERARSWLPRPGAWMETLKQALAFPLYATVAWLLWVLSLQSAADGVLAGGVLLVGLAAAAWLYGRGQFGARGTRLAALVLGGLAVALALRLLPSEPAPVDTRVTASGSGLVSEPFSMARVGELRASGRPVFVNLTAAWCITCKVNEGVALSSERMKAAFAERNIAYLKGDWTRQDAHITEVLRSFGRAGVPLYLLYSADPARAPSVLPQILTESLVLGEIAALDRAAR